MRLPPVELLSNLGWLAIIVFLWALWLMRLRGASKRVALPSLAMQLVALAMLTAILLPVISITDDLHACQFPAEVKRSVAQADRHLAPSGPAGLLLFALALPAMCANFRNSPKIGFLLAEPQAHIQTGEDFRKLWSRPPPAVRA